LKKSIGGEIYRKTIYQEKEEKKKAEGQKWRIIEKGLYV
jgi:uncharacterized membrane protein YsdA (DUF1294 family)